MTNQKAGIDYIGVVVCGVVHDGKGNILLLKRSKNARDEHGKWDICAGAMEHGESFQHAIKRELAEELCSVPLETTFLTAGEAHRVQNGKNTHWVYVLHAIKVNPTQVKIGEPEKFDEISWFSKSTLPTNLHSQFPKIKKVILERGYLK